MIQMISKERAATLKHVTRTNRMDYVSGHGSFFFINTCERCTDGHDASSSDINDE